MIPRPTEPWGPRGPVGRGTENMRRPKAWGRSPSSNIVDSSGRAHAGFPKEKTG